MADWIWRNVPACGHVADWIDAKYSRFACRFLDRHDGCRGQTGHMMWHGVWYVSQKARRKEIGQ